MRRVSIKRSRYRLKKVPIRTRSKKREAEYSDEGGRIEFRNEQLRKYTLCAVMWESCTVIAQDLHEWWSRGTGGAIVPGDKAERQAQRFIVICRECHRQLDLQPERAHKEGWVRRV